MSTPGTTPSPHPPARLPRGVWALGAVSLLMDISSEMIHSLLPMYMVLVLGTGVLWVGVVDGLAQAVALWVKVLSGVASDRWGRRKPLVLLGYGLGALSKPLFALAGGPAGVVTARCIDRVGKGIRGAPRDALLADLVPTAQRPAAFGLRKSLDAVGALAGPLIAVALMLAWAGNMRAVFWAACVPALLAVLVIVLAVHDPARAPAVVPGPAEPPRQPRTWQSLAAAAAAWRQMGVPARRVVLLGLLLSLARCSDAFLLLRAQQLGVPTALVPLVLVVLNLVVALSAYPLGRWSARLGRPRLLVSAMLLLLAADLLLAAATAWPLLLVAVALWGLHLGASHGLLSAMVADAAPAGQRGTVFGLFNLASGVALLLTSAGAGALWDTWGASAAFAAAAVVAALGLLALLRWGPRA